MLDTNVISMLSPARSATSTAFMDWLQRMDHEGKLFLSVVSIHEIEKGIGLLRAKGATAKAAELSAWLAGLVARFDDKIIPVDSAAAAHAGQLEAKAIAAGQDPGMADATIAGIATAHDLVIVTRNSRHFLAFGVEVATPEEAVSDARSKA